MINPEDQVPLFWNWFHVVSAGHFPVSEVCASQFRSQIGFATALRIYVYFGARFAMCVAAWKFYGMQI